KDVSRVKRELAELFVRLQKQIEEAEALHTLFEVLPFPIWARDEAGNLVFVNSAYACAVDARDAFEVVQHGIELFDRAAREELFRAQGGPHPYPGPLPATVAGARRTLNVLTSPARRGSAGIAIDATEPEAMRAEIKRMTEAHRRILDQLPT